MTNRQGLGPVGSATVPDDLWAGFGLHLTLPTATDSRASPDVKVLLGNSEKAVDEEVGERTTALGKSPRWSPG